MIRLGQSLDGRLLIGTNEALPADIRHVEYYKDERLFLLVYENDESELMPTEINLETDRIIQASPSIMVVAVAGAGGAPYGYQVPLIQIGV